MPEQSELPQQKREIISKTENGKEKNSMISKRLMPNERPEFPKRAIITAGMPYGNKTLHCGHVGGLFIHADTFARFMRDRIGKENVIFVSGTDCYGSPIMEGYRKLKETSGFTGSIEDYVKFNHDFQKKTLKQFQVSLDFYGASGLNPAKDIHAETSKEVFETLRAVLYELPAISITEVNDRRARHK